MLSKIEWPRDYRELFWEQYPRRIAKKAAMKALDAVHKSGEVPFEILISAVKMYARSVVGKEMRFVAYPASWVNAGRWDDDPGALGEGKVKAIELRNESGQVVCVQIKRFSVQADAWEKYRGKPIPWGPSGTWVMPTEWPPVREAAE